MLGSFGAREQSFDCQQLDSRTFHLLGRFSISFFCLIQTAEQLCLAFANAPYVDGRIVEVFGQNHLGFLEQILGKLNRLARGQVAVQIVFVLPQCVAIDARIALLLVRVFWIGKEFFDVHRSSPLGGLDQPIVPPPHFSGWLAW